MMLTLDTVQKSTFEYQVAVPRIAELAAAASEFVFVA